MNKLRKPLLLLLASLFQMSVAQSQNFKTVNKRANEYFAIDHFHEALPLFLKLDSMAPGSAELNYKIGYCYLSAKGRSKSLSYLEKAEELGYSSPGMNFNLGIAYHANQKMEEALHAFEKAETDLTRTKPVDAVKMKEVSRYIQMCRQGMRLMAAPISIEVENMGDIVNTSCPEYAPVISADESSLLFTTKRPCALKPGVEAMVSEDIYISEKDSAGGWTKPLPLGKEINSSGHDASIALSADAQKLFIYKDLGNGDIFESIRKGSNWSVPIRISGTVNSKFWEPSASISADGNTLFFVSDRPGGFGGTDIYISTKTALGEWSAPQNAGAAINTGYDEDGPFIHADGKTLYFSSDGPGSMGGFDIFSSVYDDVKKTWTTRVNIGFPINTVEDDIFFTWSPDGKRGYFSSDRAGGVGDKDLYKVTRPAEQVSLIMLRGVVSADGPPKSFSARITVTDNATGKVIQSYDSDSASGKYLLFLTPGRNYGIAAEAGGFLPFSENIAINANQYTEMIKNIRMQPLEKGKVAVLKNVFFDSGKADLKNESFHELDYLVVFLQKNSGLYVEIAGHTDSTGNARDNQLLSEERAKSVVAYLVRKGLNPKRLFPVGYGAQYPISSNNTEAGKSSNRRTEMIVLEDNMFKDRTGKSFHKHYHGNTK